MSMKFDVSILLFMISLALLILHLDNLSIDRSRMLKFPSIVLYPWSQVSNPSVSLQPEFNLYTMLYIIVNS